MKRKKAYVKRILTLCMALLLCVGTGSLVAVAKKTDATKQMSAFEKTDSKRTEASSVRTTLGGDRVADNNTMETWTNIAEQSTQYTGRIWTDKSVFTDGVILPGSGAEVGGEDIEVSQGDSDFLVGLSALSSTSNITTQSAKPLDIVLVLDTSGSMAYGMDGNQNPPIVPAEYKYEEVYLDNEDDGNTYFIKNGNDWKEVKWHTKFLGTSGWRYDGYFGTLVVPKADNADTSSDHVQFYKRSEVTPAYRATRLYSMQTAVNNFIDAAQKANEEITGDAKHRLSIVTYASNANTRAHLQEVTAETAESLKNTVNNLSANGATQADEGMQNANTELKNARENAQQVVIFFTDGSPTSGSRFEASVANTAVQQAGEIKSEERGGLVYSIGIFDGAEADNLQSNENKFMNAVSSNYPKATAYDSLGDRVDEKKQYYKTATEASGLNQVFEEIFDEIKNPGSVPTEVVGGDPMNSGYITFKDELGAYMKVDGFNEIVFADQKFQQVEKKTSGNTDTYTFSGTVDASDLYPNGSLNEIVITVERSDKAAEGDKVTVKIPAALIPLRQFDVQETDGGSGEYTTTVTNTYPMRIFFGVSLKEKVAALLENPDADMKAYIKENTGADGKVNFYSNAFAKDEAMGDTTASFVPADTNSFYYFGQDSLLYTDENCETVATRANSGNSIAKRDYWYQRTYYEIGQTNPQTENIKIEGAAAAELLNYAKLNSEGQWYIPKDAPRLATIHNTYLAKDANKTQTATDVINPQWGRDESQKVTNIDVYLGNNGKLSLDAPGTLEISKAVTEEKGLTAPDEEFTFKVNFTAAQGTELKGSYTAQKFDKDGKEVDEAFPVTNGDTVKLKAGEKVRIYGLAKDTQYTVTEENLPTGFTQTKPENNEPAEGTIGTDDDANGMNQAAFTNTYAVEDYTIKSVDLGLKGTKTIKSKGNVRPFKEGDIFKFDIKASQQTPDAPLPDNATDIIEPTSGTSADISFGDFTFTKPGEYRYSILEYLPSGETADEWDKIIPGITYDHSEYRLIIKVQDNHKGNLIPTYIEIAKRQDQTGAEDWKTLYENTGDLEQGSAAKLPGKDESYINFVNTWNAKEQSISLSGKKTLNGKSLGDYSVKEQFGFKLEAAGFRTINSQDEFAKDDKQPMPEDKTGKQIYRNSSTGDITISGTTFKTENVGKEYKYILRELQPTNNGKVDGTGIEGAEKNDNGQWVYKGITFDKDAKEIVIKVNSPDGTNEIQAQVTGNNFEFVNSYDASTTLALSGTKKITGRDFKGSDQFTFEIAGENGAPLPKNNKGEDVSSVTINPKSGKEATIDFGTITFTQADMQGAVAEKNDDGSTKQYTKDFTYTLTETGTDGNGMTYDKEPKKVTITVTDDNHGTMKATVKEGSSDIAWTNKYTATGAVGEADLTVTKVLNGRAMKAGEFHFTIKSAEDTPQLTKNFANEFGEDGAVQTLKDGFELAFNQNDIGKTFTYVVDEVENTDDAGITYDKSEYQVAFTPKDNGDGTITPEIEVTKVKDATGKNANEPVELTDGKAVIPFVNTYSTEPGVVDLSETAGFTKAITGRDWKDGDSFTFNITGTAQDGSDAPMPQKDNQDVTSVTVDYDMATEQKTTAAEAETEFGFGTITFDKAGVYTYTVTEEKAGKVENGITYSNNTATVTVTVEDKEGTGTLTATPVISNPKFVNTYKAALDYAGKGNIAIFKTLHGTNVKDNQFSFTVKAKDEATEKRLGIPMDGITEETNPATEGQRTEVARLNAITFTEADAGKTYTFTVEERNAGGKGFVYDDTVYEVAIAVTDLGEGKLKAVTTVQNVTDNKKVSETTWTTDSAAGTTPIALDFTNVYRASDDVAIKVTKEVTGGRPLKAGEFTFKLKTKLNKGGTGREVATATNKADGTVDFGTFTYTTTGYQTPDGAVNLTDIINGDNAYAEKTQVDGKDIYTVNYIASEVTTNLPAGMTSTTQPFAVTVTVTDNGDGTLKAEATTGKFTNTYATINDDIQIGMNGTKTIDTKGVTGLTPPALKDKFTFELKALDGGPAPTNTTATTDEKGNVDFGTATFNSALLKDVTAAEDGSRTKEFKYEVNEVKGNLPGVSYDTTPKTFTVTLKDDGKGNLSATTSAEAGKPLFAFVNNYGAQPSDSSITDKITIQKKLEGRTLNKGEFTFLLTENVDGKDTVVATGTNDENGKVTFKAIQYTKPGNHTYTVREQIPDGATDGVYEGVTYDKAIYTITTEVTDNGDGTLKVTHAVKDGKEVTFTNTYEAKPTAVVINASKKLVDKKLEDGQFTFELRDENDKLVGKAKKNNADGQVVFDEITYDKAGTYKYAVSEINDKQDRIIYDDKKYSVEVKVADNGKGSYVAEVSYPEGAPSFVNTYEKPTEPAKPEKPDENKGDGNVVSAKTGDTAQTGAWLVLMIAAIVGIGAIIVIRRQHRR